MTKIALVTGANRGLGKAVSKQLAAEGFQVIATSRNKAKGEASIAELNQALEASPALVHHPLDITDVQQAKDLAAFIEKEYGRLDVLVNNAGIIVNGDNTTEVSKETMLKTLETNLLGPLVVSRELLPLLYKSEEAKIVNVSSGMGALNGMGGGHAGYRISKSALNSFTAVLAADTQAKGVQVFAVCPGWVHTEMGGAEAPRTPEEGAYSITWPILNKAQSGRFYRDGNLIEW